MNVYFERRVCSAGGGHVASAARVRYNTERQVAREGTLVPRINIGCGRPFQGREMYSHQ
jgi:hypothetical protein